MNHAHEVVYISGAISSDPNYQEKFASAQMVLESLGYHVISPTMIPPYLAEDEHMDIDIVLVSVCDTLCLLPDWTKSNGSHTEYEHASDNRKRIILYAGIDTEPPRW